MELMKVCGDLEGEMRIFDATRVKIEEEKNEVNLTINYFATWYFSDLKH